MKEKILQDNQQSITEQIAELCGDEEALQCGYGSVHTRENAPQRLPVMEAIALCPIQGLQAALTDKGEIVVVAKLDDGTVVMLPDNCPHDGGLLSDGFVDGKMIVCARHAWEFDGISGQCLQKANIVLPCSILSKK